MTQHKIIHSVIGMRSLIHIILISLGTALLCVVTSPGIAQAANLNKILTPKSSTTSSNGDIVVQQSPGETVAKQIKVQVDTSWPYYLTRASGIVAAILLGILLLSGIGFITGATFKFLEPITAWSSHRSIGIAFGVCVLIHMVALLFDKFVPFNVLQILIPFTATYMPVKILGIHLGTLWVAFGVFAFYALLVVIVTSLIWVEKRASLWKLLHFLSYLILALVFFHSLYLGADLAHGIFRVLWILAGLVIVVCCVIRLRRAWTLR